MPNLLSTWRLARHTGITPDPITGGGVRLTSFLTDRRGSAGTEFALLAPVLVLLLIGVFDYSSLAYDSMQVSSAAHAGANYALHNGWNANAVQTAVTSATTLSVSATPAPQLSNACVSGNVIVVTQSASCASGGVPGSYVIVNAQAAFSPLFVWSGLVMPSTITAQATVRIQ